MGLDQHTINCSMTLMDSLRHMDDNRAKYVVVVDDAGKVLGTITDGDIRRGLLKGIVLESSIDPLVNRSFQYLTVNDNFDKVIRIFHEEQFQFIPILDDEGKLYNIMTRHILNAMLLTNQPMTFDYDFDVVSNTILEHEIFMRPWGYYKTMVLNELYQSKIIYVLPGQKLSLQSHNHREEYWMIISGKGIIQLGESQRAINPGDTAFIPKTCKHRIVNTSNEEVLIFSEVQLGDYFGEDDIIRFDDAYGRYTQSES